MRRRPPGIPMMPGRIARQCEVQHSTSARLGHIRLPQGFLQSEGSSPVSSPCLTAVASRSGRCLRWRIRKRLYPEVRSPAALDPVRAVAVIASRLTDRHSQPLRAGLSPFKRTRPERSLQPRSR